MTTSHRQALEGRYRMFDRLARNERHKRTWREKWAGQAAEVKRQMHEMDSARWRKALNESLEQARQKPQREDGPVRYRYPWRNDGREE